MIVGSGKELRNGGRKLQSWEMVVGSGKNAFSAHQQYMILGYWDILHLKFHLKK